MSEQAPEEEAPEEEAPEEPAPQEQAPDVPDRADDDRDVGWGDDPRERDDDERFLRERPPHW